MSSSDDEASLDEEKWDDMAIVRAFEDAMQGKRGDKKALPAEHIGKQRSRKESSRRKQPPETARTPAAPHQWNESHATQEANSHHSAAHTQPVRSQSTEEIYQTAYAQAYAHLQAQWQPGYHHHHQQAFPPSYQQHGDYSFPSQWATGMPAGIGMQAPAPSAMPFPSAPGGAPLPSVVQDDLANLLMSWYQSGYYTGRYQAMQEMRTKGPR